MINTKFQEVTFIRCKLAGLNFSQISKILLSVKFLDSNLAFCNFPDLNLSDTKFVNCQLNGCDFLDTNLKNALFENTSLPGTQFDHCDLSGADFRSARDFVINLEGNKLDKAIFSLQGALTFLETLNIIIE